jgi:hypothetical protein
MGKLRRVAVAAVFILTGTSAQAAPNGPLCRGKGTIDQAKPIPSSLAGFARTLFGDDAEPVYRCMNDEVYVCDLRLWQSFACARADTRRVIPDVVQYCKQEPDGDVPMAASGHATIHGWKCVRGRPVITSTDQVDARGFRAETWHVVRGVQ